MKRLLIGILLVLSLVTTVQTQPASLPPGTPAIFTERNVGSVIVLDEDDFTTACHVLKDQKYVNIAYAGRHYPATKQACDEDLDVAWVRTNERTPIPWDHLAPCNVRLVTGDYVQTRALFHENKTGQVLGVVILPVRGATLYHTATIQPGDSGGPVFNREGYVVGSTLGYLPKNINVALHIFDIRAFLGMPCQ